MKSYSLVNNEYLEQRTAGVKSWRVTPTPNRPFLVKPSSILYFILMPFYRIYMIFTEC
jgi:hypothetical protein